MMADSCFPLQVAGAAIADIAIVVSIGFAAYANCESGVSFLLSFLFPIILSYPILYSILLIPIGRTGT